MSTILRHVLRHVRKHSGTRIGLAIQRVALAVYRESCNPGYHFADNGELRVLEAFAAAEHPSTVLDVGANHGHWSSSCVALLGKRATVYAFEPSTGAFDRLRSSTRELTNVHPFQIGLSGTDCEMDILVSDSVSEKSSVEAETATTLHAHISDFRRERQRFVRGDGFCLEQGIEHIDLLKVDTEGHDLQVLAGFKSMISRGQVGAIQFEYNRMNIFTKYMLHEFYDYLNNKCTNDGYVIGRIYPKNVGFKPYSVHDENFVDGNFLAIRTGLTDLIARLGG